MAYRQLRYDLQVKKNRVLKSTSQTVKEELVLFFDFINTNALLRGLLEELRNNMPDFEKTYSEMVAQRRIVWPQKEIDRVRVCLAFIEHCMKSENVDEASQIAFQVGFYGRSLDDASSYFLEHFFMPLYEYLDGHIEEYSSVLYIIEKFKLRSQWFDRKRLYDLYLLDTSKGENVLDKVLREFLFDNGVEYPFSTPASSSGRADIIASLHTPDPIIVEVKIFDGDGRSKSYIRQGFRQIHDYMTDYNKNVGYLVIFNVCDKDLQFRLTDPNKPPRVHLNNKTIFLVVIDIYHDMHPASERPQLQVYEIKENELVAVNE